MNNNMVSVVVSGDMACFTESGLDLHRSTYPFPTPSAVVGMLSSIYWKPEMIWVPVSVEILNPIRETFFRTKERKNKIGADLSASTLRGNRVLVDVEYRINAYPLSLEGNYRDSKKHFEIFQRRLEKGQQHTPVYLGSSDFMATVKRHSTKMPIDLTINTGRMLFGFPMPDARTEPGPPDVSNPIFFDSYIEKGVVHFPEHLYRKVYPHALRTKWPKNP